MDTFSILILAAGLCYLDIGIYYLLSFPRMYVSQRGLSNIEKWKKTHRFIRIIYTTTGILLIAFLVPLGLQFLLSYPKISQPFFR
jgi:hypothetical protein